MSLQNGLDTEDSDLSSDELHFIIVHQVYELWFKLLLRQMRLARDHLAAPKVAEESIPHVVHHLRRVNAIFVLANQQWRVVETLTPQDFLAFRDKLIPASGFQSFQLREIEILMGLAYAERIQYGKVHPLEHIAKWSEHTPASKLARARISNVQQEVSILAGLNEWLYRTPIQGSRPQDSGDEEVVDRFLRSYLKHGDENSDFRLNRLVSALGDDSQDELKGRFDRIRESTRRFLYAEDVLEEHRSRIRRCRAAVLFIESYRELPLLAWPRLLLDAIVEMEEQMVLFRHGHARMVERVIGRRVGTGGSGGVDYLDKTLKYRVFRDLWAIRTVLLPRTSCPPLEDAEVYGFAALF